MDATLSDHHPNIDAGDGNLKSGQSDERMIYEVQQGREPFHVDLCSISIDGNLDNDILQQRLHHVARQRDELQQMEIDLRAQIIARSEIFDMQKKFDAQIKEHSNSLVKLQEQLCGREQTICEMEQKVEDKDREIHAIKLDNEAAWAKEDLFREQDEEVATYRRERDRSEAERSQHIKQIHDLQEHILEKERQIIDLQEQHRVSQETSIYKDEQLREAHAWIARVREMDVLQSTTNHSLQAELRERTEQYNQLWLGCQRQFSEMERLHLHSIQQLQLELADVRERSGTYADGSQTSQAILKADTQYGKNNGSKLDSNGSTTSSGNEGVLSNGTLGDVSPFAVAVNALSQGDQIRSVPQAPSLLVAPTYLTTGQVTAIHPFVMHQQGVPQSIVSHFNSAPAITSIQQWQNQQSIPENELQLSQNDEEFTKSTTKVGYEMSVNGPALHPDYLKSQNGEIGKLDVVSSPSNEGTQANSNDRGLLVVSQPEQSLQYISSQFHNSLRLDSLEHKAVTQEQNVPTSNDYAEGKTSSGVQPSSTVKKSPSDVTFPHSINNIEFAIDRTRGSVPPEAFASNSLRVFMAPDTPLLDERSLLACIVRTIPAGGRIQISSTLPNRLVKMLAPLHWHDYQKKYGKLDDFVVSHPELFVIEGDYIQLQKGAQEMIAATAAVAKVAAAAAASSPDASFLPSVAVTPMAQAHRLRKILSADSKNGSIVQNQQLNGVCFGTSASMSSVKLLNKSNDIRELNNAETKPGQLSVRVEVGNGTVLDRSNVGTTSNQSSIGSMNGRPRNSFNGKHQGRMAGAGLPSRR